MRMTCLNERIVGAMFFSLSGLAFAGDLVIDSPVAMTVTNIAPQPLEVVSSIPEPQRYLQRYEMEYQSSHAAPAPIYTQIDNFYTARLNHDFQPGAGKVAPALELAPQPTANYLHLGPSTAPQLSLVDLKNTTLALGTQPQRRLSLTVDEWVFSATARVAILHSHSTGATVSVRRGF
jgi:hypothetical protein